jgi:recombinational DNA repair ATPase RecF
LALRVRKRTTVITLKLSELGIYVRKQGNIPCFCWMMLMSELDPIRQQMLLEYIGKVQTFITLTDLSQIPDLKKRICRFSNNQVSQAMESISF